MFLDIIFQAVLAKKANTQCRQHLQLCWRQKWDLIFLMLPMFGLFPQSQLPNVCRKYVGNKFSSVSSSLELSNMSDIAYVAWLLNGNFCFPRLCCVAWCNWRPILRSSEISNKSWKLSEACKYNYTHLKFRCWYKMDTQALLSCCW